MGNYFEANTGSNALVFIHAKESRETNKHPIAIYANQFIHNAGTSLAAALLIRLEATALHSFVLSDGNMLCGGLHL